VRLFAQIGRLILHLKERDDSTGNLNEQ
jgi:hypothetical protein